MSAERADEETRDSMGQGVAVDLPIGVAIGLGMDNLAMGIAIGLALSPAFGLAWAKST